MSTRSTPAAQLCASLNGENDGKLLPYPRCPAKRGDDERNHTTYSRMNAFNSACSLPIHTASSQISIVDGTFPDFTSISARRKFPLMFLLFSHSPLSPLSRLSPLSPLSPHINDLEAPTDSNTDGSIGHGLNNPTPKLYFSLKTSYHPTQWIRDPGQPQLTGVNSTMKRKVIRTPPNGAKRA
ncbi:predicted protein [Histoplasma capsulatum var. duboisii H88]|uniref:Predicted protein n=2 Tax=Ajellomyces capsulatus TaxID=5037 RepID=F0UMF6_AJEC8|nr:predicted protein [Histoplasma capsulatum H143]EGC47300.1 predicted protein [Histoplasma capsulatum var. duboisii H88]